MKTIEERRAYDREYHRKRREKYLAYSREYAKNMSEEQLEKRRAYQRQRYRSVLKQRFGTAEYKDERNAKYKQLHQDYTISAHGQRMRDYFEHTTRESRAEERARRQAIEDIKEYLMGCFKITDKAVITRMLRDFYENE